MLIYLYIKQHRTTKLLYFGKTRRKNPEKYIGSGRHWNYHIKKHGNHIDTLCIFEFDDQEECTKFALQFSQENDIVQSKLWANSIPENGLDGRPFGVTFKNMFTDEECNNRSKRASERWSNPKFKTMMQEKHKKRWDKMSTSKRLEI